jgi:hypothetical protein
VTLLYVKQAAVFRIGILRRVRLGLDRSQFESKVRIGCISSLQAVIRAYKPSKMKFMMVLRMRGCQGMSKR